LDDVDKAAISLIAAHHAQPNISLPDYVVANHQSEQCCMYQNATCDFDAALAAFAMDRAILLPIESGKRMARFCALLHLADGLDIDYTRLPIHQLLSDPKRSIKADCENFKRQVLFAVDIDRGFVVLTFRFPKMDSQPVVNGKLLKELWDKAEVESLQWYRKENGDTEATMPATITKFGVSLLESPNKVDLVCNAFKTIQGGKMVSMERRLLSRILYGILDSYMRLKERNEHRLMMAIVAALDVCCEAVERYQAMIDVHLDAFITLGPIGHITLDSACDYSILEFPLPDEAKDWRICPT
jgi:hypothetical protein